MKRLRVAAQLIAWMARLGTDLNGVLDEVALLSFDGVEVMSLSVMLPKFTVQEISDLLDSRSLKLAAIYSESDWGEGPQAERELDLLKRTGGQLMVVGGPHEIKACTREIYSNHAQIASKVGKKLNKSGITLCYHPHATDLKNNLKVFLEESDPENVSIAMDTTWFTRGGINPAEFLKEHGKRVPYVHLKDFKGEIDSKETSKTTCNKLPQSMRDTLGSGELAKLPLFVPVGEGELNFKPIMKEISKLDIEWVAVEQDRVFWGSPKDNMQASRENLKKRFGI